MRSYMIGWACAAALAFPVAAQTDTAAGGQPDIMQKAVNQPSANWNVYGSGQTNKGVKAEGVPGNGAVQVTVASKGSHPYDVGASSPIQKKIGSGDAVLVAVYLRAPKLKEGETTPVGVGATLAAAPYTSIANDTAQVGAEWKLFYASGKAPQDFAPNTANASLQLSADKHVVELGPVFVLDFGPDQDLAKLPHN